MGLFSGGNKGGDILKQAEEAIINFETEIARLNAEKDSQMRRQVEIWSVSNSDSNQGMENEYRTAASGVALNVKKVICLEEHVKKLRLAQFHAKNGDKKMMEETLAITDPCANIKAETPDVIYRPAPSMVLDYKKPTEAAAAPAPAADQPTTEEKK